MILIRKMYYEATNQIGADPRAIELHMPCLNAVFICGTEGWNLCFELLDAAFSTNQSMERRKTSTEYLKELGF